MRHFTFLLFFMAVITGATGQNAATFDELETGPAGYWNGSDGSGRFKSGPYTFHNSYNTEWASWAGFSYSKKSDTLTAGWSNQYSAITGKDIGGAGNYGVGYVFGTTRITFEKPDSVSGMYLTNNTYTYYSMKNGDDFTKKFGGKDGKDPDYFRLLITGIGEKGDTTGSAYFYLADFRFDDPSRDYIVKNWEWFDLSKLGIVTALHFSLESTDMGAWGMNTPSYFCVDNINRKDFTMTTSLPEPHHSSALVYPTIFGDQLNVELPAGRYYLEIMDLYGRKVYSDRHEVTSIVKINELASLKPGIYFLNIEGGQNIGKTTFKLRKLNQ